MPAPAQPTRLLLTRQPRLPFERVFLALLIGMMVAVPLIFLTGLVWQDPATPARLLEKLQRDPRLYVLPLVMLGVFYWQWRLRHHEQLRVDAQGIQYTPPFHWWRRPAFRLKWSELDQLELLPPARGYPVIATTLRLHANGRQHDVKPMAWFPPAISWRQQRARQKLQTLRRSDIATAFAASALGQFVLAQGLPVMQPPVKAAAFDLFSNGTCRAVLAVMGSLLLYALIDGATLQQRALDHALWPLMLGAGVLSFPAILLLLLRSAIPRTEAIGVASLFGLTLAMAAFPGSLRVNQLSDGDGAETVNYVHRGNGHFVAPGYPDIRHELFDPFWDQLPRETPYTFRLYRGSLGFWQLDEAPINDAMRAFYRRQRGETD